MNSCSSTDFTIHADSLFNANVLAAKRWMRPLRSARIVSADCHAND